MKLPIGSILKYGPAVFGLVKRIIGGKSEPKQYAPERPGADTSEFRLTVITHVVAIIVAAAAVYLPGFPSDVLRELLLGLAGLSSASAQVAYTVSRSRFKGEAARAVAASRAAHVAAQPMPRAVPDRRPVSGARSGRNS